MQLSAAWQSTECHKAMFDHFRANDVDHVLLTTNDGCEAF
jgi:hypothetical protein